MIKWAKRIVVSFFLLLGVLVGSTSLLAYFYEDELKQYVLDELNNNLTRKVGIVEIDYTVFKHFPNISVELNQVVVQGIKKEDTPVLNLQRIDLVFDLIPLFQGNFNVGKIALTGGQINIAFNKDGLPNYEIWKVHEDSNSTSQTSFLIQEIKAKDVLMSFQDVPRKLSYQLQASQISIIPRSLKDTIDLGISVDGEVLQVAQNSFRIDKKIPLNGDIVLVKCNDALSVDFTGDIKGVGTVVKSNVILGEKQKLDLLFDMRNIAVSELLAILPVDLIPSDFKNSTGSLTIKGRIKGDNYGVFEPSLEISGDFNSFSIPMEAFEVSRINGGFKYTQEILSSSQSGLLRFENTTGAVGKSTFQVSGLIRDFNNPWLDVKLDSQLNLNDIHQLYAEKSFKNLSGIVSVNCTLKGRLIDIFVNKNLNSLHDFRSDGTVKFNDLAIFSSSMDYPVQFSVGDLSFNDKHLTINKLEGQMNSSKFIMDGEVSNFLKTLLLNEPITFRSNLRIDHLQLEEFISKENSAPADSSYEFSLPKNINLEVKLNLEHFRFRKFEAEEVIGRVQLKNQQLTFSNVKMRTCNGNADISGKVSAGYPDKVVFECAADLKKIDAKMAFDQFENFGQSFLLGKHVQGKVSTEIYFLTETDRKLNMKEEKIYTKTKIKILDGKLVQFEPLIELQQFLKDDLKLDFDLSNLSFKSLENDIEIINKTIYIPAMLIQTKDIDLEVEGEHTFDQHINYLFKVKHSQIFKANKINAIDAKYGVKDNGDQTATLPLRMTGTVDNPKFSYDIKEKKEIIKDNLKEEGKKLREIILEEFKGTKEEQEQKKKENEELNTERKKVKFQLEFDEDEEEDLENIED